MALPIDQLIKSLSEDEVKATIYDTLVSFGVNATAWQPGGVARAIIAVLAKVISGFTPIMSLAIRGTFLDSAEGDWLTLLAKYVYGVTRIPSIFATGKLTVTNSGGGLYDLVAGEMTVKNPVTGKTYKNVSAVTINPSSEIVIDIVAVEAGAASTTMADTITAQETQFLGVSVNNAAAVIGTDEESDKSLRQRCQDALGALSPLGAAAAYSYFAKTAVREDGSPIGVNRTNVVHNGDGGVVNTYVLTASGELPGGDLTLVDDFLKLKAAPLCVTSYALSPSPVAVEIKYVVLVDGTVDSDLQKIRVEINAALNAFMSEFPINGYTTAGPPNGHISWTFLIAPIGNANKAIRSIFVSINGGVAPVILAPSLYVAHTIDPASVVELLP